MHSPNGCVQIKSLILTVCQWVCRVKPNRSTRANLLSVFGRSCCELMVPLPVLGMGFVLWHIFLYPFIGLHRKRQWCNSALSMMHSLCQSECPFEVRAHLLGVGSRLPVAGVLMWFEWQQLCGIYKHIYDRCPPVYDYWLNIGTVQPITKSR